jgi:hypothetical protein
MVVETAELRASHALETTVLFKVKVTVLHAQFRDWNTGTHGKNKNNMA